jgi:DNA-binding MarR family transcriptional regulator
MDESMKGDCQRWLGLIRKFCAGLCPVTSRVLTEEGLNLSQYNAVALLQEKGEITMSALSKGLGVTMGAGTSLMDTLVERGLADRRRSSTDRRVVKVTLMPKGVELFARCTAKLMEFWSSILAPLEAEQRSRSLDTFDRVLAAAESARAARRAKPVGRPAGA